MQPGQHRETARILLTNQRGEIFLLLTHFDPEVGLPPRWITPGGGIDDGETPIEAAVRELFEETGLQVDSVGEPIWSIEGTSVFNDGHVQTTYSEYFVVRTQSFDVTNENWMENEFVDITDVRWWTLDELAASGEKYSPEPLLDIIQHALNRS